MCHLEGKRKIRQKERTSRNANAECTSMSVLDEPFVTLLLYAILIQKLRKMRPLGAHTDHSSLSRIQGCIKEWNRFSAAYIISSQPMIIQ